MTISLQPPAQLRSKSKEQNVILERVPVYVEDADAVRCWVTVFNKKKRGRFKTRTTLCAGVCVCYTG